MTAPRPVPVLMYHKVGEPVLEKRDTFINVSATDFRRQMRFFASLGYQARTFAEVVEAQKNGKSLPKRVFTITFDDGYQNVGDFAAPILAEFGFPATVFVVSQAMGKTNAWDAGTKNVVLPLMGLERLRELQGAGWEVAGHTRTHPKLSTLAETEALAEILRGKEELETLFNASLTTFCYPYGDKNAQTPRLVQQARYLGACTTQSGLWTPQTDPFLIPRVKIAYRDRLLGLLYRLYVNPHLPRRQREPA